MKILIIDDDPFIVDMYTLKLKEAGFEVDFASDGRKGLEKITESASPYSIVLLDAVLPIMDGFEVLQNLERAGTAHPPIVLLTNLGQKEDVDRGMSLGAADYMVKAHFTPSELVEKIKHVIGKNQESGSGQKKKASK